LWPPGSINLEKLTEGRRHKEQVIDSQTEECNRGVFINAPSGQRKDIT